MANLRFLLIIILIALVTRIVFVSTLENSLQFPDEYQYDTVAKNVISGKGFIVSEEQKGWRPPIYPLFLGLSYTIFGDNILIIRLIHSLLGVLSCLLVYFITCELFDKQAGLIAALITALYPFFIFFTGLILSETLFVLELLLLVWCLVRLAKNNSWQLAILSGLINGITILTKPSFGSFIFFLLPFWLLIKPSDVVVSIGQRLRIYFIMFLFTAIIMTPWIIRNYVIFGQFIPLTTHGGQVLYESNSQYATGGPAGDIMVIPKEIEKLPEIERDNALRNLALKWISEHPKQFIKLAVIKFVRFWNFIPNFSDYRSVKYALASIGSYGVVLLLALWELIRIRKRWKELLIMLTPLLYYTLLHMVFVGSIRYRIPIEPYLIILASNNILFYLGKLKLTHSQE